jgi:hypothetical protein
MSGSATLDLERLMLGHTLAIAPMATLSRVYVALCRTAPTEAAGGEEVNGPGYARSAATFTLLAVPANAAANATAVDFAPATGDWGTVAHFEIWTQPTGGTRLYWGQLVDPADGVPIEIEVTAGDVLRFSPGSLVVQATDTTSVGIGPFLPTAGGTMTGPLLYTATGGIALRPAQDRAADVANVLDYGATGDGMTDDGAAIRAAVAALGGLPGSVTFPPGTYRMTGGYVVLPSGTRVTGAGSGASIIKPDTLSNPDGTRTIFVNTLRHTLGLTTAVPATPANQTDHDIEISDLGFDLSNCATPATATSLGSFLLARNLSVRNIHADNYQPASAKGFSGFQFVGCDGYVVDGVSTRHSVNAVDNWKGSTRGKISNVQFESADAAGNGGQINWNSIGTTRADFGNAIDLQISNATVWLNGGNSIGIFLDSLGAASVSQDILLNNIVISARTGTTGNIGVLFRGLANRLKARGLSFDAASGADMRPVWIDGFYDGSAIATGTNLITTTNGSNQMTVSYPGGANSGPGNYLRITNGSGGAVVGNGLSLNGYYLITAVSGPVTSVSCGDTFTVTAPANATASGPIAATTQLTGWWGCPTACDLVGLTFDGISASGGDLITANGSGHQIIGVMVTSNYQGAATPQYRSVVSIDSTLALAGVPPVASNVIGVVAAAGTGALGSGFIGDNVITWRSSGLRPAVWYGGNLSTSAVTSSGDATVGNASANYLTLQGRPSTFPPRVVAEGSDANVSLGLRVQGAGRVEVQDGAGTLRHFFDSSGGQLALAGNGQPAFKALGISNQVNFVVAQGGVTGAQPSVTALGSADTNISVRYGGAGAGGMLGRALQITGPPTTTDLPAGYFTVAANGSGSFSVYYNNAGTIIKSAALA